MRRVLALGAALLALAGCGGDGRAPLAVGAVEDASRGASAPQGPMKLARDAGLGTNAISAVWTRGANAADDMPPLRRAVRAANSQDVEPVLAVWQLSANTPVDDASRAAF